MSRQPFLNSSIGEYRVVGFLGAGGMGEVYRAVHSRIGRVVAVKVLAPAALATAGITDRFLNEARIQASLQHPNIATLYDFLEVNGQPCIIMEYVDGMTLSEQISAHGPLRAAELLRVFRAIVEAIRHVHGFDIIHRDIKANNVKLNSAGQVKLLDFGIAKAQSGQSLTQTGSIIGTIEYLAPEQIEGRPADVRSDIWALGVLLYQMATGCTPFRGQTLGEVGMKIIKADYVPPSRFNPALPSDAGIIISRCLKKDPARRYQTADALLGDVARISDEVSSSAPPHQVNPQHEPVKELGHGRATRLGGARAGRKRLLLTVSVAMSIFFLAFIAFGLYRLLGTETAAQPDTGGEPHIVRIDTIGVGAEVYRDGQKLGETPFPLDTRIGEHVRLTLKREGFEDMPLDFNVSAQTKDFSLMMRKLERAAP